MRSRRQGEGQNVITHGKYQVERPPDTLRGLCTSGYVGCSLTPKRQPLYSTFLRKEQPSVSRALPPVGWQSTVEQPLQMTTVCACEKTVVLRGKNVGKDESASQAAR